MLCVTEMAMQVAATEAHKDGGRTAVVAFALQGVEYLVDLVQNKYFLFVSAASRLCERSEAIQEKTKAPLNMDCFVVPPRNDAKRTNNQSKFCGASSFM